MSNFTTPLHLKPQFSKRFAIVLIGLHCGALLLLIPLILPIAVKLVLSLFVLMSAQHASHRHLQLNNHPLYGCILHYDKGLQLQTGQEAIASGSYNHPQLVILRVLGHTLVIWKDALDVQTFRQLRVYLRHANKSLRINT